MGIIQQYIRVMNIQERVNGCLGNHRQLSKKHTV